MTDDKSKIDKFILYYPYKYEGIFSQMIGFFLIVSIVITTCCIIEKATYFAGFSILASVFFLLVLNVFTASSRKLIIISEYGICISEKSSEPPKQIPWEAIKYSFRISNFKGHDFLIVSSKEINKKKLKKIVLCSSTKYKILVDEDIASIYINLNSLKSAEELIDSIIKKTIHTDYTHSYSNE